MADTTQIIELTIDLDKAVKDTTDYKIRVDELKRSLELLKNSQDATGEEIAKATAEYQSANEQLRANEKVLKQLTGAQNEEAGTLEKLTARNAQLRLERQKLNLDTKEGALRLNEINKELDTNNERIRENSDAAKKQSLNIGNYASGVIDGFKGMVKAAWAFVMNPIGAVVAALVGGFLLLKKALGSTEAGSNKLNKITGMLAGVFNGLLKVLTPLAMFIADVVIKQFEILGKIADNALSLVSKGLKAIGFDKAAESVDKFANSMEATAKASAQLADETAKLNEQQRLAQKIQLDYQKAAEKLRQIRDDESKSIKERSKANEDLNKVLKEQEAAELSIANQALKVADLRIKAEGESTEALDQRAEALTRISDIQERISGQESEYLMNVNSLRRDQATLEKEASDKKKALSDEQQRQNAERLKAEAEAAVSNLELELKKFEATNEGKYQNAKFLTQNLVDEEKTRQQQVYEFEKAIIEKRFSEGLSSKLEHDTALLDLDIAAKEQQRAVEQEWADIKLQDAITAEQLRYDAELLLAQESIFAQLELEAEANEQRKQADLDFIDQLAVNEEQKLKLRQKINQKYAKADVLIEKTKTKAKLALAGGFAENIATIAGEQTAIGKAAAVAATTISTFQGATAAFTGMTSSIPGPVGIGLGIAAAAAAVVSGLANVKKILAVKSGLPGDSAGGGGVPSAGTPMAAPGPLPTGASPTIGQGIVSRDTVDTTGQMKTAFSEALNESPVKTAVVVDQVTAAQTTASNNEISATI